MSKEISRIGKLTSKEIIAKAEAEVREEIAVEAAAKLKKKLQEKEAANKVLANVEREIEDLKLKLAQDLGE